MTIAEVGWWGRLAFTGLLGNIISALSPFLRTIWRNPLLILLFRCYSCHHLRFAIRCHFNALFAVILILLFSPVSLMFLSPLNLVSAGGPLHLDTGSPICCLLSGWYNDVGNVCLASPSVKLNLRLCLSCLAVCSWQRGTGSRVGTWLTGIFLGCCELFHRGMY